MIATLFRSIGQGLHLPAVELFVRAVTLLDSFINAGHGKIDFQYI